MKHTAITVLVAAAVLLMLYPFWGLLYPQSYAAMLATEHTMAVAVTPDQVRRAAAMNWAANGLLASCFVCLAGFIAKPARTLHARWAAGCLLAYPAVRSLSEAIRQQTLNVHGADTPFALSLSVNDLFYVLMGIALLGIAATAARPKMTAH